MSENLSQQETKDKHTKEFWLDSKFAAGEKYLIKVHLPVSYFKTDTTKYSVLYLTDADWFFGTAIDCAYWLGNVKTEIIVIGITYGSPELAWIKRDYDFDFEPTPDKGGLIGSERYVSFMENELFPKVENEFRIDSSNRTLFGWSGGAIFALYVLFNYPELFAKYLVSGAPLIEIGFNVFQMGLQFRWEIIPNKRHEYKAAANLLANGLDYLYGNMSIVTALRKVINKQGIAAAITEYHRLKKDRAEDYNIIEGEIDWLGGGLLSENRITEAIEIFKLNVTEHPDSWNAYDSLGKAYKKNGDNELAIKNYKKSLELNPENTDAVEILKELPSKK